MPTPDSLRAEIANCRIEADRLLGIATDPTVKAQIRTAMHDLNEAEMWLNDRTAFDRASTIDLATFTIDLAASRLTWIDRLLKQYGADMEVIG